MELASTGSRGLSRVKRWVGALVVGFIASPASAFSIFLETNPDVLAEILFPGGDGLVPIPGASSILFQTSADGGPERSVGYFVNAQNTYGLGDDPNPDQLPEGIVLSSGDVFDYNSGANFFSENTTEYGVEALEDQQQNLLGPISEEPVHFDVTQLNIRFMNTAIEPKPFDLFVAFGSEEVPVYVSSPFTDGFGAYLNGTNIAFVGGLPINIDHPYMAPILGTELNAVLAPVDDQGRLDPRVRLSGLAAPGENELVLIIGDASDPLLDSTVFVSRNVSGGPPDTLLGVPLLPGAIDPETGGFIFDGITADPGEPVTIDPLVAIGYTYEIDGDPGDLFASVLVGPVGGDESYPISFEGVTDLELPAGIEFFFTDFVPEGVLTFTITGIDPEVDLPPDNPLAFVTTVTFVNAVDGVTLMQTPITEDIVIPEPGTMVMLGALGARAALKRRKAWRFSNPRSSRTKMLKPMGFVISQGRKGRRGLHPVRGGDGAVGQPAALHVQRRSEGGGLGGEAVDAHVRQLQDVGLRGVTQGLGAGTADGAGHVRDAVMDDPIDLVYGLLVRGGA